MAGEVHITIRADDLSQRTLEGVAKSLQNIESSGRRASIGFESVGRAAQGATRVIERGMNIMTRLDLVQITVEQSSERVRNAQEKYNDAIARFGPHSQQAVNALRELDSANAAAEKTNLRARLSYVLVVGDIISLAVQAPRAIQALNAMRISMLATAGAGATMSIALTGGLAAIGILVGLAATTGAFGQSSKAMRQFASEMEGLQAKRVDAAEKARKAEELASRGESIISPSRVLDPEFLTHSRRRVDQRAQAARAELAEVDKQIEALKQRQLEAARAFEHGKEVQAAIIAGTEPVIRAELEKTIEKIQDYNATLAQPIDLTKREQVQFLYDQEVNKLGILQRALNEATETQEDAAKRTADAWSKSMDVMDAALSQGGVALENLSLRSLADLSRVEGALGGLAGRVLETEAAERGLIAAALDSNPALMDQVSIQTKKGESSHELAESLGLTVEQEQELLRSGRLTEEGLISQAEAMRRLQQASASMGGGDSASVGQAFGVSGTVERSVNTPGWARFGRGHVEGDPLEEFQTAFKNRPELLENQTVSQAFRALISMQQNPQMVTNIHQLAGIAQARQLIRAQHGFEGMVNGPQLFLAGEAGREHVQITPQGKGGLQMGQLTVVNQFNGPANERDVERGMLRGIHVASKRLATRKF